MFVPRILALGSTLPPGVRMVATVFSTSVLGSRKPLPHGILQEYAFPLSRVVLNISMIEALLFLGLGCLLSAFSELFTFRRMHTAVFY